MWDAGAKVLQGGEFPGIPHKWLVSSDGETRGEVVRRGDSLYRAATNSIRPSEKVFGTLEEAAEWLVSTPTETKATPYLSYVFDCPFCERRSVLGSTRLVAPTVRVC